MYLVKMPFDESWIRYNVDSMNQFFDEFLIWQIMVCPIFISPFPYISLI